MNQIKFLALPLWLPDINQHIIFCLLFENDLRSERNLSYSLFALTVIEENIKRRNSHDHGQAELMI